MPVLLLTLICGVTTDLGSAVLLLTVTAVLLLTLICGVVTDLDCSVVNDLDLWCCYRP